MPANFRSRQGRIAVPVLALSLSKRPRETIPASRVVCGEETIGGAHANLNSRHGGRHWHGHRRAGTGSAVDGAWPEQIQSDKQMQEEADKGIKTRDSGESGFVGQQESSGASAHPPGRPDASGSQTTGSGAGSASGQGSETNRTPR
jgi:hypothetical protein